MPQAQQNLELLILRIHSGLTYRSAKAGINIQPSCKKKAKLFQQIEEKILDQKVSALAALKALQEHWTLITESEDLAHSKSYLPQLQFKVLIASALVMGLASQMFFPENLQADTQILSIALALVGASYFWSQKLLRGFEKEFWLNDWNLLISEWLAGLRSGRTFVYVLSSTQKDWKKLSPPCRAELTRTLKLTQEHRYSVSINEGSPHNFVQEIKKKLKFTRERNFIEKWVLDQIVLLRSQALQGGEMENLLVHMIESNRSLFKRRIHQSADKLQMKLLIPVFVLLVPAFLILLFAPLLKSLWQLSI